MSAPETRLFPARTPAARAIRVLVADDEPVVQALLARALEAAGYVAVVARDGIEAFDRVLARPVDAAFVDLDMPRMDGYEALGALRHLDPHLTVVAITGGGEGAARLAVAAGAMECLRKPLALDTIGRAAAGAVAITRRRRQVARAAGFGVAAGSGGRI